MRFLTLAALLLIITSISSAQVNEIALVRKSGSKQKLSKSISGAQFSFSQDKIYYKTKTTKDGNSFADIWLNRSYPNGEVGTPNLPAYKKLIRIPKGSTPTIKVISHSEQIIALKENGINYPIYPNQASVSKSQDSTDFKFEFKKSTYSKNSFSYTPIATIEVLGNLRSATIARVVVNPIDYNPADGIIKVYNDIDIEVSLENGLNTAQEQEFETKTFSPYFDIIYKSLDQSLKSSYTEHPDLTKYPVKMLIVSNRMFEQSLQPFIQWKTAKGFYVKTLYTDIIGHTSSEIKAAIAQEYNSATLESPAPSFLVITGDVDRVPASTTGSETNKLTDLYYASVDGDMFPDMYYGRLSATNTTQLDNIINKILYYEKYQFEDPSYLNRVTLIAGTDGTWNPRVGQPTIKYGTANYFKESNGFSTVNEYGVDNDPNNSIETPLYAGCYDTERIGVGLINYTAHCGITEWSGPNLAGSSISGFTNTNKYPLSIGNCCLSGDFGSTECIGEAWIRAQNRGAVTYIGSSPNTFWLEDFYWSVGAFPIVGNNDGYVPTFQETTLGMYDAPFVSNYVTTGAMVFAGNLAVTEVNIQGFPKSQASSDIYYWQAYNILGDPSLMPYFTEGELNQVNYLPTVVIGESSFTVSALANSFIALSKDNQLIGSAFVPSSGDVDVPITPILTTGDVVVVITRPQTVPIIDTITAISPTGPYLMLDSFTIDDQLANNNGKADYNEQFATNLKIKNIGIADATNVRIKIEGIDDYIIINSNDSIGIENIPYNVGVNIFDIASAFSFQTEENIPDQHIASFTLKFFSDQGNWTSKLRILLNSPILTLGQISIDDSQIGCNNDGLLNSGESCKTIIQIKNVGHAIAKDISFQISVPDSIKNYISIQTLQTEPISLEGACFSSIPIRISVISNLDKELTAPIKIVTNVLEPENLSTIFEIILKITPNNSVVISNNTIETCFSSFYDSGNLNNNYNNAENLTSTFISTVENNILKANFTEFETESGYDFLYVYDGPNTNSPQIKGSPFSGSSISIEFYSTGRYLTFMFHSDGNTNNKGWKATIECVEPQIPNCTTTPNPSNGASFVKSQTLSWDLQLFATYYEIYLGSTPTDICYSGRTISPNFTFKSEKNKTYYWKVIPGNYLGENNTCENIWHFTTDTIVGEITMSTNTVSVDTLLFYDSGGSTQEYKNDENHSLTMKPKFNGNTLKVNFLSFNTENSYDKLSIYNGLNASSPLIGIYQGTSSPGTIIASNTDGALTFFFHSDDNTTRSGWEAIVTSVGTSTFKTITLKVQNNSIPIANATINIGGVIKTTNSNGLVSFSVLAGVIDITVNALGYKQYKQTIPEDETNSTIIVDLEKLTTINFHVYNNILFSSIHGVKIKTISDSTYTNTLGLASIQLTQGTYFLQLLVKGYEPYSQMLIVDENSVNLEIPLAAIKYQGKFIISDAWGNRIENASVNINDTTLTSNAEGIAQGLYYSGNYVVSVSKSQFLGQSTWISVDDNFTKNIYLDYISSLNTMNFTLIAKGPKNEFPLSYNNIDLYYNSIPYLRFITDAQGEGFAQLLKGEFNYNVSREGYNSIINHPLKVDGIKNIVKDTLFQKTFAVQFNVSSQQGAIQDATITLDGYLPNYTNSSGQVVFPIIGYEKKLKYIIHHNSFENAVGTIDVTNPLIVNITLTLTGNEIIVRNKSRIYPNPTSNQLNIESEQLITKVSVINTLGLVVLTKEGSHSNFESISLGKLTPGIYILIINSENSIPEKALIIKK